MVLKSKPFPSELTLSRRFSIWAQIVIVFVLLEFALWAPTTHLRNRWAAIAAITLLVLVSLDVLIDPSPRSSFARLGLGFPKASGAAAVLGLGFAALGRWPDSRQSGMVSEFAIGMGLHLVGPDAGIHSAIVFLQPLRRALWKLARRLGRLRALRRRPSSEPGPHHRHPDRRPLLLRNVPPLSQPLSHRARTRHARPDHRLSCP